MALFGLVFVLGRWKCLDRRAVTNAFVVTDATAAEYGMTTISDLAVLETVRLGGPPECPERPRCMIGLTGS